MTSSAPLRVLHVLHSAVPDVTGGSVRSRYLVRSQVALGAEPVVVSSPFQPPIDPTQARGVEMVDGIPYYRTFDPRYDHQFMAADKSLAVRVRKLTAIGPFTRRVRVIAQRTQADVIHGHSLFYCGVAASLAARSLGLPSVYEVRSLIEDGLAQEGGTRPGGLLYRAYRAFDWLAVRLATHVVVICEGLRADLIARGVPAERITVVANGVDVDQQTPVPVRSPELLARMGLPADAFVLGYIGTLLAYESLDVVIEAMLTLRERLPRAQFVVVGDGPAREAWTARVQALGVGDRVRLIGKVPHDAVGTYYELVDLFVLPRRPTRLTDAVTPLKPLEIMARGKAVLASDCGGHRELIIDGVNGFLYSAERSGALAAAIVELAADPTRLPAVGVAARQWVSRERTWMRVVQPSLALYRQLAARATESPGTHLENRRNTR
jgi:glycogen synthase